MVSVVSVRPELPRQELYRLAACAEQLSEHPLDKAIVRAIIGTLDPVVGALVHNAGSVLVITNSAFLLNWKKKK